MIKTVIFDLDDTLYNERDYCKSGFRAVAGYFQEHDIFSAEDIFEEMWKRFQKGDRKDIFNNTLKQLPIKYDSSKIPELVDVYRCHRPDIQLSGKIKMVIEQLAEKYTLGLLTDGFLPAQQLKVEALGLQEYFQSIMYTETLGRQYWKPSEVGFLKILEDLGAEPGYSVYVADNPIKDFIAPNRLGMKTVQIINQNAVNTFKTPDFEAMPACIIEDIEFLVELLDGL